MRNWYRYYVLLIVLLIATRGGAAPFQARRRFSPSATVITPRGQGSTTSTSSLHVLSTVISPPKVDKDKTGTKKSPSKEPAIPDFLFKEARDVQKEFEDYISGGSWAVILYNDPFNKRLYVQQCLMEVCTFTEQVAEDVMMQAHNYGFAIVKECGKEDGEWFDVAFLFSKTSPSLS